MASVQSLKEKVDNSRKEKSLGSRNKKSNLGMETKGIPGMNQDPSWVQGVKWEGREGRKALFSITGSCLLSSPSSPSSEVSEIV